MSTLGQISSELSAAMALDLASDIWPEADVFRNHGIEPVYGAALLQQAWFRKMVDDARSEWNAVSNAKQRIRLKSQIAVEQAIEELFALITDKNNPAQARVAAFKELKDVSGVAADQQEAGGGATMPTVNIFLGGDSTPSISITGRARPVSLEPEEDLVDVTPSYRDESIEGLAPLA